MTDDFPTRRSLRHNKRKKPRMSARKRTIMWTGIGLGVLLLAFGGWIGVRGLIAKSSLEAALPLVSQLKESLKSVDLNGAQATVDAVAEHTAVARSMTADPVWAIAEMLPLVGSNLVAFRQLAEITDDITTGVLEPVASLGDTLDPKALKPVDGRIDPALFADAIPVVTKASTNLASAYDRVKAVDTSTTIGAITDARTKLQTMLDPMVPLVNQAAQFVDLIPGLLGADGPKNYLLVFQNNSEARALGGHAGSWAQISVNDGKIDLTQQSSVFDLKTGGVPVIDIDPNILSLWSGAGQDPSNVTLVPRLDLSAETAAAFWQHRYGIAVDAVVFIDPVALGYLLEATGPITLPTGDVIDSVNASSFLLNAVYLKYPLNEDQDIVFNSIAKLMFGAVTGGNFDPKVLVNAALKAGAEHRLLPWFFDENVEKAFAATPFTLDTPVFDDKNAGFGVYITDNLGSKMTYYVDTQVQLAQAQCASGETRYEVKVTVRNILSAADGASLPTYVANTSQGGLRVLITLYAPPGSSYVRDQAAGWDPNFVTLVGIDGEYPVMTQRVTLAPDTSVTGTFILTAPDDVERALKAYVTPLARPMPPVAVDDAYTC